MQQKLVTVHLCHTAALMSSAPASGSVEEHLSDDLDDGWRIVNIVGVPGSGADIHTSCAWLAVLLEK